MLEGQEGLEQEPQAPEATPQGQPEPAGPTYEEALEAIAQRYGQDPQAVEDAIRIRQESERVYQESRRRLQEAEQLKRDLEAQREAAFQAPPDYADPSQRWLYDQVKQLRDDLKQQAEERRQEREEARMVEERGNALSSEYEALMEDLKRRNEPIIDRDRFFGAMNRLRVPIEDARTAIYTTYGYLNSPLARGYTPAPNGPRQVLTRSGPRAEVVIPGGAGPAASTAASPADIGPQGPNETTEQYVERLRRAIEEAGITMRTIPEGIRFSSG